jgi:PadR family transcriptional regulator, regulatory protein PadR
MRRDSLRGHLDLLLLATLEKGPAHGYAVIERLRESSGGEFDYPEGTIYPALHKLESEGLVSSRWAEAGGRRRRVYSLTRRGRVAAERRAADWERFANAVRAVIA